MHRSDAPQPSSHQQGRPDRPENWLGQGLGWRALRMLAFARGSQSALPRHARSRSPAVAAPLAIMDRGRDSDCADMTDTTHMTDLQRKARALRFIKNPRPSSTSSPSYKDPPSSKF